MRIKNDCCLRVRMMEGTARHECEREKGKERERKCVYACVRERDGRGEREGEILRAWDMQRVNHVVLSV